MANSIKLGDYLSFGTYKQKNILWRCVAFHKVEDNTIKLIETQDKGFNFTPHLITEDALESAPGYVPLFVSDEILDIKYFDTAGKNKSGSHARRTGDMSAYWGDSNIRCWLNSDAAAGKVEWICGNPPEHVYIDDDLYFKEDKSKGIVGFLNGFTKEEKEAILHLNQINLLYAKEYSNMDKYKHAIQIEVDNREINEALKEIALDYQRHNRKEEEKEEVEEEDFYYYDEIVYYEELNEGMFLLDVFQLYSMAMNMGVEYLNGIYDTFKNDAELSLCERSRAEFNELNNCGWEYWLRSHYYNHNRFDKESDENDWLYLVDGTQLTEIYGPCASPVGVRPAFYFNEAISISGEGSKENPYHIV